jgi:hypothetical protein
MIVSFDSIKDNSFSSILNPQIQLRLTVVELNLHTWVVFDKST